LGCDRRRQRSSHAQPSLITPTRSPSSAEDGSTPLCLPGFLARGPSELDRAGPAGWQRGWVDGSGSRCSTADRNDKLRRQARQTHAGRRLRVSLTAPRCVDRIYTDLAVIDVTAQGFVVLDVAPGVTRLALTECHQCSPHMVAGQNTRGPIRSDLLSMRSGPHVNVKRALICAVGLVDVAILALGGTPFLGRHPISAPSHCHRDSGRTIRGRTIPSARVHAGWAA